MHHILTGIEGVDCFIDDVTIWGSSKEAHDQRLSRVLGQMREKGVKFSLQISSSGSDILWTCLVSRGDQSEFKEGGSDYTNERPESEDDLRRFLGLVAYVAKEITSNSPITGVTERGHALVLECDSGRDISADCRLR